MKRSPYTFPHRSRKAMLAYLGDHESYVPMNTWNGGFVLAWNIKVHRFDEMGHCGGCDAPANARFDSQWRDELESNHNLFNECCENATRQYTEGEWTNYPGIEQGEWQFGINGWSGGYMILTHTPTWCPSPCRWRCFPMVWESRGDYQEWLGELDTPTLKQFYRAIRVLDRDLRREACGQEVSYHFAWRRSQWEESLLEQETCNARKLEASRPDMYQS